MQISFIVVGCVVLTIQSMKIGSCRLLHSLHSIQNFHAQLILVTHSHKPRDLFCHHEANQYIIVQIQEAPLYLRAPWLLSEKLCRIGATKMLLYLTLCRNWVCAPTKETVANWPLYCKSMLRMSIVNLCLQSSKHLSKGEQIAISNQVFFVWN